MKAFFRNNSLFFLVLLLSLIKGFLWIHLIPVLQSPDAERHFSTMIWYAEPKEKDWETSTNTNGIDFFDSKTFNIPKEYANFLMWYGFEESRFNRNNHQEFSDGSDIGPNEASMLADDSLAHFDVLPPSIVEYPKPYYLIGAFIYDFFRSSPIMTRILAVETYTLLLSLGTIFFAYKTAILLSFNRRESALFAGIISFQPMFSFISVSINPDTPLILGFSAFFYFALKTILKDLRSSTVLGMLAGALISIYSKPTGYAVIPLLGFALCIGFIRKNRTSKKRVALIFTFSGAFFAAMFGAFLRFGESLGLPLFFSASAKFDSIFGALVEYLKIHLTLDEQYRMFSSYWGRFGWLDYPLPIWIYAVILSIIVFSLIGLVLHLLRKDYSGQKTGYVFLLVSTLFFHIVIIANEFNTFKDSGGLYGNQGRYFLPTIIPLLFLIVLGLGRLTRGIFRHERLLQTLFILMVLLNIYSLTSVILPAYYL